ncbi:agmatine deiminase family protein [Candidatus Micrarchaeota archaeon]|nr:agmatine deiminase family protein [Candidatus Micrarchaeota archaeon]
MTSVLASSSIRFPGEWDLHAGTWLAWPHDEMTFPDLAAVEKVWLDMIRLIAKKETVNLLAHHRLHNRFAKGLAGVKNVVVHDVATADVWLRDTGPIFVKESISANVKTNAKKSKPSLRATCWQFNAWGNKYETLLADRGLNEKIAGILGVPKDVPGMVLEGGSVDSNGAGLCLTSEQCLLNNNRNPSLSKAQVESKLKKHLGFRDILWLGDGLAGDDTDGHIDDMARFVNAKTVVHAMPEPDDKNDVNHAALTENETRLKRYAKIHGLKLQEMPMPPLVENEDGPLPASYCNFYIANAAVLVPIFKAGKKDQDALSILKEFFPDREVVGLDCRKVVEGMGALHCVTQQQPA